MQELTFSSAIIHRNSLSKSMMTSLEAIISLNESVARQAAISYSSLKEKMESNCLSISSQFDSNILQLLEIPGRILVPPVTQIFRSK